MNRRQAGSGVARAGWPARFVAAGLLLGVGPSAADSVGGTLVRSTTLRALDSRSAALLVAGQEGGELSVAISLRPLGGESEPLAVDLVVDVAGSGLEPAEGQEEIPLALYAYAFDSTGSVRGVVKEGVRIDAVSLTAAGRAGVKFLGRMALPSGRHLVRVLALRADSRRFGVAVGEVVVPQPGEEDRTAFVAEPAARWLRVVGTEAARALVADDGRQIEAPTPATRPVFGTGGAVVTELVARRVLDPEAWAGRLSGRYQRAVELSAGSSANRVEARFDASALPPGEYRLELVPAGGEAATFSLPIVLAELEQGVDPPAAGLVWTDIARGPEESEPVAPRLVVTPSMPAWQLEKAYLNALSMLAEGEQDEAVLAVMAAEASTLAAGDADIQEELLTAQLQIAGDLARIDVDSLLPVIALHQRLYSEYLERRAIGLATRSRRIAARVALAYADLRRRGEGNAIAARALESLAGHVMHAGGRIEAVRLFRDAIELDSESEAALYGLGLLLEAAGEYGPARRYYEQALAVAPDNREISLHLAVNLGRAGQTAEAERLLRVCLGGSELEWVAILAHQELARLLDAQGRRPEAIELLSGAVSRFSDAGLVVQLAAMLDSAGRRPEASERLSELERWSTDAGASPRQLYARRDFSAVRDSQVEFRDLANSRSQQLRTAYLRLRGVIGAR